NPGRKRSFRPDQGGVISAGQGIPPTPQFFGECPSTTTHVCSRRPSVVASQSASVSPAISLRLVSSSILKSNSFTSISGIGSPVSVAGSGGSAVNSDRRAAEPAHPQAGTASGASARGLTGDPPVFRWNALDDVVDVLLRRAARFSQGVRECRDHLRY